MRKARERYESVAKVPCMRRAGGYKVFIGVLLKFLEALLLSSAEFRKLFS